MDGSPSALGGEAPAGVVDQATSHLGCHQAEERLAGIRGSRPFPEQAEVRLVEQGRRLQRVMPPFPAQEAMRYAAQLGIGPVDDLFAGFGVAVLPRFQQLRDISGHVSSGAGGPV
jgi:hypothetical protein